MKKKTILKLISITLLIIIFLIPTQTLSEASSDIDIDTGLVPDKSTISSASTTSEFDDAGKVILGAIQTVGVVISVIVIVIVGIKYMIGSVDERAEYKKTMWPYIIGVILLASATTIPNIIYKAF